MPDVACRPDHAGVRANYDRLSRWYGWLAAGEKRLRIQGLALLQAQPGETMLEVGFGAGDTLVDLAAAAGNGGRVCGADLSLSMAHVAQARLRRFPGMKPPFPLCADTLRLPWKNETFDGLFSAFTIETLPENEMPAAMDECHRVLRRGGRLCMVSLARVERHGLAASVYAALRARFPGLIDCRPIDLSGLLHQAGFTLLETRRGSTWGLPVETVLARRN